MGREKIRILPMKSRTFLTNWEMEDDPFTSSTNNAVALKLKRKNFKLLLKKLKLPLNKKRTRFLEHNLSLVKFVKRLTERSMRRKKSLTTPAKITNAPWTLCKLLWKLNLVPRQKPSVSRRSWNLTSMSSKLPWTTPTRPTPKLTNLSSAIKVNSVILKDSWNPKPAKNWKSPKAGLAERKANALQGELEESRALLDSADRSKKQTDMELAEARSAVNDMTTINSKAASEKRHLESAIHTMHAEIDDMLRGAKGSEDKAKKAMVDAARLADELRAEQDHCAVQEGKTCPNIST